MSEKNENNLNYYQYFYMPIRLEVGKILMWHSICSIHRSHDKNCGMCNAGSWVPIEYKKDETPEQEGE